MVDQSGRDNPPIFYLDSQIANYRYHALLTEPVSDKWDMLMDLNKQDQNIHTVKGEYYITRPRGLYGFQKIEDRDKWCRRCDHLSEIDESPICYPVTVPNLQFDKPFTKQIKAQTGE